jgi:cytochrome c oxidase subunit 2
MTVAILATITCLGIPLIMMIIAILSDRPVGPAQPRVVNRDTASRAGLVTFVLWAILTAAGVAATLSVDFYSVVGSDRGEEIANAFRFLTALAMPVAALVIAVLVYSVLRRGTGDLSPEDGEAFDGTGETRSFPRVWFGASAALTLLVIIYPGLWTLNDVIKKHETPELIVDVEALQWTWLMSYPEQDLENQLELVIPVDTEVTFNITSRDVVHSFWVPAFLMKIDAIPGHTTTISLIAVEEGDFSDEPLYRLQCAELCGLSHANMRVPVRVVSQSEFEDWLGQKSATAP